MLRPTSLLRLLAAGTLLLGCGLAHGQYSPSQYSWIDAKGVRHFSDLPPPPSTPPHKILKGPGSAGPGARAAATEAAPAAPAKGPNTLAQREEQYRARSKMRAEQDRKDATEAQRRRDLAAHCKDAREMQAQMESGIRIAKFDAKGERSFMTDEERTVQLARTRKALAQCRQPTDSN